MLADIFSIVVLFLREWWWLILPLILYPAAKNLYLYWIGWEIFYRRGIDKDWGLFEIIPPSEIEKPFKAMEDIFTRLWPIYDGPCWRERWCGGEFPSAFWFSFEIVSIEGKVHFYIRIQKKARATLETAIQTHYPEAEIIEVEDYTLKVPQDVPNRKYEMYGEDYKYWLDEVMPIKTYEYFESSFPESIPGEKKMDPIYSLLEHLTKLRQGEQFWVQAVCAPVTNKEIPWVDMIKDRINKEVGRKANEKPRSIVSQILGLLFFGKPLAVEKAAESVIPPEMHLTPGEKETVADLEKKKGKYGFKVWMRTVYLAEREKYFSPNGKIFRGYLSHFVSAGNFIMFWSKTRPRLQYFFRRRREYKRKRDIFEKYVKRLPPKYPNIVEGTSILSTQELASLFHFPLKASNLPPGVPRVVVRKRDLPPGVPLESAGQKAEDKQAKNI